MADDQTAQTDRAPDPAPTAAPRTGSSTGAKVGGWILISLGGLFVVGAIALVVIHLTQRDNDGYYTSSSLQVGAPGYAVTSQGLDIGDLPSVATDAIGRIRVHVRSSGGQALFVGIGHQSDVERYLAGVRRSEVTNVSGNNITYRLHQGGPPAGPPERQGFWQASGTGSELSVTWKVKGGTWMIVLMNASGAAPVSATVSVGANTNLILWVGLGCLVFGLILAGAGTALLFASRGPRPVAA